MSVVVSPNIVLSSGVQRPYACMDGRWDTYDELTAIWGACDVGRHPTEYRQPAFVFQHDTREYRVNVRLPGSGQSLADIDEAVYRIFNASTGATVISKTLTGGDITLATASQMRWTLDTSETGVAAGYYQHELRVTEAGAPSTIMTGPFRVVDTVIGD